MILRLILVYQPGMLLDADKIVFINIKRPGSVIIRGIFFEIVVLCFLLCSYVSIVSMCSAFFRRKVFKLSSSFVTNNVKQ